MFSACAVMAIINKTFPQLIVPCLPHWSRCSIYFPMCPSMCVRAVTTCYVWCVITGAAEIVYLLFVLCIFAKALYGRLPVCNGWGRGGRGGGGPLGNRDAQERSNVLWPFATCLILFYSTLALMISFSLSSIFFASIPDRRFWYSSKRPSLFTVAMRWAWILVLGTAVPFCAGRIFILR